MVTENLPQYIVKNFNGLTLVLLRKRDKENKFNMRLCGRGCLPLNHVISIEMCSFISDQI